MTPVGFELAISVSKRPQIQVLDRKATRIGLPPQNCSKFLSYIVQAPSTMASVSVSQDLEN